MSKTIHPVFGDKHREYMQRALHSTISVAEGAVRSGKTVDNVAVFAKRLELGVRDKLHLATGSTSANAKLNIGDCNGFGLEHIFRGRCKWTKYKGNDALEIRNRKGRTYIVIFAGGGKADSYKKVRGNSYGMWIATEINLHHENSIKESFNRLLAAKDRCILWDLNPSAPNAYIYKDYIDRFTERYGKAYNYEHFVIQDNSAISKRRKAEIEAEYDKNSVWYKRDILGLRTAAEGVIYGDSLDEARHFIDYHTDGQSEVIVSSDFGIQNATVFLLWEWNEDWKSWVCFDMYYYSGRDEKKQKTVAQLVDGLDEKCKGRYIRRVIIDPSASALIVECRKRGYKTRAADNEVKQGISDVATALSKDMIRFAKKISELIKAEFESYVWDEKALERGEEKPLKESDHIQDAIRYFVKTMGLVKHEKKQHNEEDEYLL